MFNDLVMLYLFTHDAVQMQLQVCLIPRTTPRLGTRLTRLVSAAEKSMWNDVTMDMLNINIFFLTPCMQCKHVHYV